MGQGVVSRFIHSNSTVPQTIYLTVYNEGSFGELGGCFVPTTVPITVLPAQPVDISVNAFDGVVCSGQQLIIGLQGKVWWTDISDLTIIGPTQGYLDFTIPVESQSILNTVYNTTDEVQTIEYFVSGGCDNFEQESIVIEVLPEQGQKESTHINICHGASIPLAPIILNAFEEFEHVSIAYVVDHDGTIIGNSQEDFSNFINYALDDNLAYFSQNTIPLTEGNYQIGVNLAIDGDPCAAQFIISITTGYEFDVDWDAYTEEACIGSVHEIGPMIPIGANDGDPGTQELFYAVNGGPILPYPDQFTSLTEGGFEFELNRNLSFGLEVGDEVTVYFQYVGEYEIRPAGTYAYCPSELVEAAYFTILPDNDFGPSDLTDVCVGYQLGAFDFFEGHCLSDPGQIFEVDWSWTVTPPNGGTIEYEIREQHLFEEVGVHIISLSALLDGSNLWTASTLVNAHGIDLVIELPESICSDYPYLIQIAGGDTYEYSIEANSAVGGVQEGAANSDYPYIQMTLPIEGSSDYNEMINLVITAYNSWGCQVTETFVLPLINESASPSIFSNQMDICSGEFLYSHVTGNNWELSIPDEVILLSGEMQGAGLPSLYYTTTIHQFYNTSDIPQDIIIEATSDCSNLTEQLIVTVLPDNASIQNSDISICSGELLNLNTILEYYYDQDISSLLMPSIIRPDGVQIYAYDDEFWEFINVDIFDSGNIYFNSESVTPGLYQLEVQDYNDENCADVLILNITVGDQFELLVEPYTVDACIGDVYDIGPVTAVGDFDLNNGSLQYSINGGNLIPFNNSYVQITEGGFVVELYSDLVLGAGIDNGNLITVYVQYYSIGSPACSSEWTEVANFIMHQTNHVFPTNLADICIDEELDIFALYQHECPNGELDFSWTVTTPSQDVFTYTDLASHSFSEAGLHYIELVTTDDQGVINSFDRTLMVNDVDFAINNPDQICTNTETAIILSSNTVVYITGVLLLKIL